MKKLIIAGMWMMVAVGVARATLVVSADWNTGFSSGSGVVPDGNATGWTDTRAFTGLDTAGINAVTVRLNISGGYNGDLFGYLVHEDASGNSAGFSMLLDRVGTGSGGAAQFSFGFATAGFNNVTLSDAAGTSIHDVSVPTGGTYSTDGGSLANFNGNNANGTWTLFLADMSGGDTSTVVSWGLDIAVVPEPVTWALIGFGLLVAVSRVRGRRTQTSRF